MLLVKHHSIRESRDSSVGIGTGWVSIYCTGRPKFFLFSVTFGPTLGPTQTSIQWGLFPRGQSDKVVKLTTHLHQLPKSRMVELYLHYPVCLHGVVLN
jgi:hypothetical protein